VDRNVHAPHKIAVASVFAEAFLSDPDGSWELITSDEFGMGASMLRRAWYQAMHGEPLTLNISALLSSADPP